MFGERRAIYHAQLILRMTRFYRDRNQLVRWRLSTWRGFSRGAHRRNENDHHRSSINRSIDDEPSRVIDKAIRKSECLLNARWSTHSLSWFADLHIHNARTTVCRKNAGKQATRATAVAPFARCGSVTSSAARRRKSTRKFFFSPLALSPVDSYARKLLVLLLCRVAAMLLLYCTI